MKHVFWVCLFYWNLSTAQISEPYVSTFNLHQLSTNDGLSNRIIHCISEDQNGSIWIGTADGLNRIDGNRVQSYFFQAHDRNSLCNNAVKHIYAFQNQLWIGTEAGVSIFDLKTRQFSRPDKQNKTPLQLEYNTDFLAANKQLYIFGQRYFYRFKKGEKLSYLSYTSKSNKQYQGRIDFAFYDRSKNIWGVSRKRLGILDSNRNQFKSVHVIGDNRNEAITSAISLNETFFLGTWGNGLVLFDPKTKETKQLESNAQIIHALGKLKNEDGSVTLIAGTNLGYFTLNTRTLKITEYALGTEVRTVFVDSRKNVWLGTDNGVFYAQTHSNGLQHKDIAGLINSNSKDKIDEHQLINTISRTHTHYIASLIYGKGFILFDKKWNFIRYSTGIQNSHSNTLYTDIRAVTELHGTFWVCTDYGLLKCKRNLDIIKTIQLPKTEKAIAGSELFRKMIPYKKNLFIVQGLSFIGIFDTKNEVFTYIAYPQSLNNTIPDDPITGIELFQNELYVTSEYYFYKINLSTKKIDRIQLPFLSKRINDLAISQHKLWIATQTGLIAYDIKSEKFRSFYRADGLTSDHILQLKADRKQHLWIATTKGLTHFNTINYRTQAYQNQQGIIDEYLEGALFIDDDGKCVFSTINELALLNPSKLPTSLSKQRTIVTSLSHENESVNWTIKRNQKHIALPYSENDIAVHFTIPAHLPQTTDGTFYYKLNGNWKKSGSSFVELVDLPIGTTEFTVASSPRDSAKNDTIFITILTPWYYSWWFISLIICLCIIGIYLLIRLRERRLKSKLRIQVKIKDQIRSAEMTTLRSQMNPHFMFNALNSINRFIIENDSEQASGYLSLFSKLMRNILENSKKAHISLKKELDALRMYMDLEAMRLENKFDYSIELDTTIDQHSIELPPLILQPFVENAIWHGIHQLDRNGHIRIHITQAEEQWIEIHIIDDGIGLNAAKQYKQTETNHKSYGIETTVNRITLDNKENTVTIQDRKERSTLETGTIVSIKLFQEND